MTARMIILTGPPGAGKTTLAERLTAASPATAAAHLHSDDFFGYIRKGFIAPWLTASARQNAAITEALAASACAYARAGIEVVLDGIVGPWFLGDYRDAAAASGVELHYVVLRLALETARVRARERAAAPLADYPKNIHRQLSDLGDLEGHALVIDGLTADEAFSRVAEGLASGRFRLPA